MIKALVFLKGVFSCGIKNKSRFVLITLGLFVSSLFLSFGIMLIDSYYKGKMNSLQDMPDNSVAVVSYSDNAFEELYDISDKDVPQFISYQDIPQLLMGSDYGDSVFSIQTCIVGLGSSGEVSVGIKDEKVHVRKINLLEGRLINTEDVANMAKVIVIDNLVSKFMFGDESPIGQTISLLGNDDLEDNKFEIVGVIDAGYNGERMLDVLKAQKKNQTTDSLFYYTNIYMPKSTCEKYFYFGESEEGESFGDGYCLLWSNLSKDKCDDIKSSLYKIKNKLNLELNIIDYENDKNEILAEVSSYKSIFAILLIVAFIFSGLNCMNITFFSVKERIREIGIRKAFGAGVSDIVLQIVAETVIISVIGSILGVLVSIVLISNTRELALEYFEVFLQVSVSWTVIVLPIVTVVMQTIVFSLVPAIYAAKIKVVDALHFE